MQAVVTRSARTMELTAVDAPPAPGPGQVLVRPEAVGICGSDYHFLTGELVTPPAFGPQFPRVQGHEVAGTVVAVGDGVPDRIAVGEHVVALGAGPIGQATVLAARERGAEVLVTDFVAGRLELARQGGAATVDL